MKSLGLLLLLVCLPDLSAQSLPETQRLYCNLSVTYEVKPSSPFKKPYLKTVEGMMKGTCWAANFNGQPVFLTAAHVLARGPNFMAPSLERGKPQSLEIKPIIGLLGYEVQTVGFPKGDLDWVALRPKDARAFKGSQIKELSKIAPKVGETMKVIGFPDTAHEQQTERKITSISPNGEFIIFNQGLEPGYSGGVVLNGKNQAVGVVVTSGERQSTAILLSPAKLGGLEWKAFEQPRIR